MKGFKPNAKIWKRINAVIMGESAADVAVTMISGLCQLLIQAGAATSEEQARAHLAAMLISPDNASRAGSLLPQLQTELARLNDGRWLT